MTEPIPSPCIRVCVLIENICVGCRRTIDQIRDWAGLASLRSAKSLNGWRILPVNNPMDHYDRLADLLANPALTPEGAETPNKTAALKAAIILEYMSEFGIIPDRIVASEKGGIALCWFRNGKYADVVCMNTGEFLCLISDRSNPPIVWIAEP